MATTPPRGRKPDGVVCDIDLGNGRRAALLQAGADGRARLDGNHTHFVLADSDGWGGETPLLMALADALAGDAPVAFVLAGGGTVSRLEALEAVEHGWPLFVIEGTGGAADAIAGLWDRHREPRARLAARLLPARWRTAAPRPAAEIGDPQLRRIVTTGDVRLVATVTLASSPAACRGRSAARPP